MSATYRAGIFLAVGLSIGLFFPLASASALSDAANKMCLPETGVCKYGTYCDPPKNTIKGVVGKYCQDVTNKGVTKGICIRKEKCLGKTFVGLDGKEHALTDPDIEEKLPYINEKGEHCFTGGGGCTPAKLTPDPERGFVGVPKPPDANISPTSFQPGSSILDAATLELKPGNFEQAPSAEAFQQFLQQQAEGGSNNAGVPQSIGEQIKQWGGSLQGLGSAQSLTPVDSAGNPTGGQFDSGGYEVPGGTTGFGAPEQTADSGSTAPESGAAGACDSWWCTYIGGVTAGQQPTDQQQLEPLRAGANGKVDPVDAYNTARAEFQKSLAANGGQWPKATLDAFRKIGVSDPTSPDQLARAAVQLAKTESNFSATLVSEYDKARGLDSQGIYQLNNLGGDRRYGIGPGDAHDPQKSVEALVKIAEQGQLSNYFGPIKRGGNLVRGNAGWFEANVAPYVGQGSTQVASTGGYVPQSVLAQVDPWASSASALPYIPTSPSFDWSSTPFQFQPATEYPSLATPQTESPYASAPSWSPVSATLPDAGVSAYVPSGEPPFTESVSDAPILVYTPSGEPPFIEVATNDRSSGYSPGYFDPNYLNLTTPVSGSALDTRLAFDSSPINPGSIDAIADGAVPIPESAPTNPQDLIGSEIDSRIPVPDAVPTSPQREILDEINSQIPVPSAAETNPQESVAAQHAAESRETARPANEGVVSGRDESAFVRLSSTLKDTWDSVYGTVSTLGSNVLAGISGAPPTGPDTMEIETGGASNPPTEVSLPDMSTLPSGGETLSSLETAADIKTPSDSGVPVPESFDQTGKQVTRNVRQAAVNAEPSNWDNFKTNAGSFAHTVAESVGNAARSVTENIANAVGTAAEKAGEIFAGISSQTPFETDTMEIETGGASNISPSQDTGGIASLAPTQMTDDYGNPITQADIDAQRSETAKAAADAKEAADIEARAEGYDTPLPRSRPADIAAISAPPEALGDSYSPGEKDPGVKRLQEFLNTRGAKLAEDGVYGPKTEAAVREFQKRENLMEVDGLAGPKTLARVNDIVAKGSGQGGIGSDYAIAPPSVESQVPTPEAYEQSGEAITSQTQAQAPAEAQVPAASEAPQTFSQYLQGKIGDTWERVKDFLRSYSSSDVIDPSASLTDGPTDISSSLGNFDITQDSLAAIGDDLDQVIREATESLPAESAYVPGSAGEEVLSPENPVEQKPGAEPADELSFVKAVTRENQETSPTNTVSAPQSSPEVSNEALRKKTETAQNTFSSIDEGLKASKYERTHPLEPALPENKTAIRSAIGEARKLAEVMRSSEFKEAGGSGLAGRIESYANALDRSIRRGESLSGFQKMLQADSLISEAKGLENTGRALLTEAKRIVYTVNIPWNNIVITNRGR